MKTLNIFNTDFAVVRNTFKIQRVSDCVALYNYCRDCGQGNIDQELSEQAYFESLRD